MYYCCVSMVFGNKNDAPGGDLDRITVKKFPDQYPAEKVVQAEPVQGDSKDVAVIRPLLKQTELGEEPCCVFGRYVRFGDECLRRI